MGNALKSAAEKARKLLSKLGVRHTVGTSRDDRGEEVVVVDVPNEVDRKAIRKELDSVDAKVVVRNVERRIIAH